MEVMVEQNGSRVGALGSQHCKFGMIAFKTSDITDKTRGTYARHEVRVTLRAVRVARGGQPNRSSMLRVTGSASGHELLRCVMQGAVMAREALLVDDIGVVKTQVGQMAGRALLSKHCVRSGQISGGVYAAVAAYAIPRDPQDGQRRRRNAKPK